MTNGRITGDFSSEEEQVMERVKRRLVGILVSQMRLGGDGYAIPGSIPALLIAIGWCRYNGRISISSRRSYSPCHSANVDD